MATTPTPTGPLEVGQGVLKKLLLGAGLSASIALYVYELVSHNPAESFGLLRQFGPSFLISIIALVFLWDLLKLGVSYVGKLADGVQDLSKAVGQIAAKDDRQSEEIQLVAQFNAQNSERILGMMKEQGAQLQQIADRLDRLGAK